ncbi:hypothetical protein LUZ63_005397 [Rhynchospora breviuscula]|uniref:Reverse transcriptase domain-containing protein n=1 Tax=Rhynchospora breviuscula TaxID=2022672 RepID=A0A9Q0HT02_9POAL|nr:hypothetical protein LUZ63_005397 [Rhynchospora breviuscula]
MTKWLRWHQHARTKWLQCGDRNTRFFHATATQKLRNKCISTIQVDGAQVVGTNSIVNEFTDFVKAILGTVHETILFQPTTLYQDDSSLLAPLALPFSEHEIKVAVMGLQDNKSCGPDGYPNEFFKLNWDLVKHDLMDIFEELFMHNLDLKDSNLAHIILLPKEDNAQLLSSFRPISVISYLPKLISKVLSNGLAVFLPELICNTQTGFVKGRIISENFNCAREIIANISNSNEPAFMMKLDFRKAFDTVTWPFLFNLLQARGFPPNFLQRINLLFTTSTSAILINGTLGQSFKHKRGLRQVDPLSPALFILAADVLSRMLKSIVLSVQHRLTPRLIDPFYLLQFADDTLLFSTVRGRSTSLATMVLNTFSKISGIDINWTKTCFVPFNLSAPQVDSLQRQLHCNCAELSMTYLGLPLTHKRPTRDCFQKLIATVSKKLAGWKCSLLSRAGRIVLTASVLSSIPVYYMSVFHLPAWVIKDIDQIRRKFIWKGTGTTSAGIPLLAWDRMCLPKSLGGFGLVDLLLQNICLLVRWWWRLYSHPDSLWSVLAR